MRSTPWQTNFFAAAGVDESYFFTPYAALLVSEKKRRVRRFEFSRLRRIKIFCRGALKGIYYV